MDTAAHRIASEGTEYHSWRQSFSNELRLTIRGFSELHCEFLKGDMLNTLVKSVHAS